MINYEGRRDILYDPNNKYGFVLSSGLFDLVIDYAIQRYSDVLIDANVIEKFEQEQIDDKLSIRWTTKVHYYEPQETIEDKYYKRYQAGLIYKPDSLLVIYSDSDSIRYWDIVSSQDAPPLNMSFYPMLFTTAVMWKQLGIKGNYKVAFLPKDGAIELLRLQPIVVPHILWTDEYDLPPLSVDAINKTINEIKESITPQRSR